MAANSRTQMVLSAVHLFRRHGYNGTGFRDVVAHSGAPRGSIYHHFPNGKAQLGAEAVSFAGDFINAGMQRALEAEDFVQGFERMWRWWTRYVAETGFESGCPVVGVAAEAHPEAPELAAAAAGAFTQWQSTLTNGLRGAGYDQPGEAEDMASLIVAALEGATVMARAAQDDEPLVRAGRQLAKALRAQAGARRPRRGSRSRRTADG